MTCEKIHITSPSAQATERTLLHFSSIHCARSKRRVLTSSAPSSDQRACDELLASRHRGFSRAINTSYLQNTLFSLSIKHSQCTSIFVFASAITRNPEPSRPPSCHLRILVPPHKNRRPTSKCLQRNRLVPLNVWGWGLVSNRPRAIALVAARAWERCISVLDLALVLEDGATIHHLTLTQPTPSLAGCSRCVIASVHRLSRASLHAGISCSPMCAANCTSSSSTSFSRSATYVIGLQIRSDHRSLFAG